ncbi:hypothetical protein PanWU01x14_294580 [Parasponia andersonii]|uniref:Transmembrane protein n=1 Tax=Parasponia andersonii TaxID=3476 RepID=A0A2P5AW71_PARAD|nr:hypothetical protein PanWU01x14_294580 [Parasponia andersonii]
MDRSAPWLSGQWGGGGGVGVAHSVFLMTVTGLLRQSRSPMCKSQILRGLCQFGCLLFSRDP